MTEDTEALVAETMRKLEAAASRGRRAWDQEVFPTKLRTLGVKVPELRAVSNELARRVRALAAREVVRLCERLVEDGTLEGRQVAYEVLSHHRGAMAALGRREVERLGRGMDNWGSVDTFACLVAGPAWREGQVPDELIERWARSPDRWWRRAAVVCTVALNQKARGGSGDAPRTLRIGRLLAADHDDMVAKALSWALRELCKREPRAVADFMAQHGNEVASRVRREVETKLRTGLKNPRRPRGGS